jgi:hemin uptake protein HemP
MLIRAGAEGNLETMSRPAEKEPRDRAEPAGPPPEVASHVLLAGHREIIIWHAGEAYRLRLTASNKLILMK